VRGAKAPRYTFFFRTPSLFPGPRFSLRSLRSPHVTKGPFGLR
jgi:hypothetical protein